jgi:hypothetical protein
MIPRYFLFVVLLLALAAVSVFAAEKSSGGGKVAEGGLVCFSVDAQHGESCDALCTKADMVCTAVAATGKPQRRCSDATPDTVAPFPVCRCCAVNAHSR